MVVVGCTTWNSQLSLMLTHPRAHFPCHTAHLTLTHHTHTTLHPHTHTPKQIHTSTPPRHTHMHKVHPHTYTSTLPEHTHTPHSPQHTHHITSRAVALVLGPQVEQTHKALLLTREKLVPIHGRGSHLVGDGGVAVEHVTQVAPRGVHFGILYCAIPSAGD